MANKTADVLPSHTYIPTHTHSHIFMYSHIFDMHCLCFRVLLGTQSLCSNRLKKPSGSAIIVLSTFVYGISRNFPTSSYYFFYCMKIDQKPCTFVKKTNSKLLLVNPHIAILPTLVASGNQTRWLFTYGAKSIKFIYVI